jgi:general secretion pathway protein E
MSIVYRTGELQAGMQAANPPAADFLEGFGAHLLAAGVVDELALQRSQRAARQSGERFDRVLIKLGLVSEADLCTRLGQYLRLTAIKAEDLPAVPILTDLIPERFIRANGTLPIALEEGALVVAVIDPLEVEPVEALSYLTGRTICLRIVAATLFEKAVAELYGVEGAGSAHAQVDTRIDEASEFDLQRLRDIANEAPIIRRVNQMISVAIEAHASDIHIEPGLDGVHVRYRIDGLLRTAEVIPPGLKPAIVSRIKIMSRLDIAERRMPQDGRIKLAVRGVEIDFRVSTIPTAYGESIVMRILDQSRVSLDFKMLGFDQDLIEKFRHTMSNPNGIVLVTGPTGSGKTTTLYTALKELSKPEVKVFTVEDPIEYQMAGVNQVQVQPAIGLDFPHALRSILRQDPDIIMIGEIRDAETARIAIQASLTGHLVFSTLHTNGAAASITRLIDMGVENYLIASTLKAVLAQRLVRKLCTHCAEPLISASQWEERLSGEYFADEPANFRTPRGCQHCHQTGYSGRSTIAEFLVVNDPLHRLICESATESSIDSMGRKAGMKTLYQSGMARAWRGETSVEEVIRVTRME